MIELFQCISTVFVGFGTSNSLFGGTATTTTQQPTGGMFGTQTASFGATQPATGFGGTTTNTGFGGKMILLHYYPNPFV